LIKVSNSRRIEKGERDTIERLSGRRGKAATTTRGQQNAK
jgi:hypothetical protein